MSECECVYVGQQFDPLRRSTGTNGSVGAIEKPEEKYVTLVRVCEE